MSKTINYKNGILFYRKSGKGKPIVLLHGFAEDGEIWNQQSLFLQNDYQLLVPDLPGSGKSSLTDNVNMEEMAEALKAILEEENILETIVIGHSMGGYVTLAFAEKYSESLKAFGLFHSSAYADSEEKKRCVKKTLCLFNPREPMSFSNNLFLIYSVMIIKKNILR